MLLDKPTITKMRDALQIKFKGSRLYYVDNQEWTIDRAEQLLDSIEELEKEVDRLKRILIDIHAKTECL